MVISPSQDVDCEGRKLSIFIVLMVVMGHNLRSACCSYSLCRAELLLSVPTPVLAYTEVHVTLLVFFDDLCPAVEACNPGLSPLCELLSL